MHVNIIAELSVELFGSPHIIFSVTSTLVVGGRNFLGHQIQVEADGSSKISYNGKSMDLEALDMMLCPEESPKHLVARVKGNLVVISGIPISNLTGIQLLQELKKNGWGNNRTLIPADELEIFHHGTLESFDPKPPT